MKAAPAIANVSRIAVVRANALGDLIFSLPALTALKRAYPDSELVLLAAPWHRSFLQGRPGPVDRVEVVPVYDGVYSPPGAGSDPGAVQDFFARMRAERFDLALQLHGGGRNSNPFTLRLGARVTAGLRTPDAAALDVNVPYRYWQHEVLRCLEVAAAVGATPDDIEPQLVPTAADLAESRAVVPPDARPLVALHPGASDTRRRWSARHFARVADELSTQGARVVVTGAATEAEVVGEVLEHARSPIQSTCGQLSLAGLTGLLARCRLVISNDTGPLHLAAAVGASTVGIYWCGNLINAGQFTRTRHRPLLSWRLECPECGTNCMTGECTHRPSFVDDVTPEEVLREARELLEAARDSGRVDTIPGAR